MTVLVFVLVAMTNGEEFRQHIQREASRVAAEPTIEDVGAAGVGGAEGQGEGGWAVEGFGDGVAEEDDRGVGG